MLFSAQEQEREVTVTLENGLAPHSRKSGDGSLAHPEEAVPTPGNTSYPQPSCPSWERPAGDNTAALEAELCSSPGQEVLGLREPRA